jgi:hypothetical protein
LLFPVFLPVLSLFFPLPFFIPYSFPFLFVLSVLSFFFPYLLMFGLFFLSSCVSFPPSSVIYFPYSLRSSPFLLSLSVALAAPLAPCVPCWPVPLRAVLRLQSCLWLAASDRLTDHGRSVCSQEENEPASETRWRLQRRSHGAPGADGEYTTDANIVLVGKLAHVRLQ